MSNKWQTMPFSEAVLLNPQVSLKRGTVYPFVDMQTVAPNNKKVRSNENRVFDGGGARFLVGDVLMARITPSLEHGKISRFIADDPSTLAHGSTEFIVVRGKHGITDTDFAYYLTRWDYVRQYAISQMTGSSGRQRVPTESLQFIDVTIPPLPEQRTIAGILGALDDKIEVNRRMNATLESMARAVFRQWFVEGEDVGKWEESSLEEIFGKKSDCVLTGPFGSHLHAHDYREEGTPLILVKHVMDGHILEDRLPLVGGHKLPEMKRYLLEVGDIVFTRVGAVGRSAYIHPRHKGWLISGQTLRVRVSDKKKLNPRFLAQIYLEQSFIDMVEQHALGTTRPSLNTNILSSFKFVLPPIEMQNNFAEFAESLDNKVQQNLDESRTLASLRDGLLPRLMSGKVRVTGL